MSHERILIVDDEQDICEILQFNLEAEGYEVKTAESPFVFMEGDPLPDLILLDVMMTPISGFEWAKILKKNPITAHIPIIFCTAKDTEKDMLEGFSLGSDDYITKPFSLNEVKARVKAVLRRSTSQQGKELKNERVKELSAEGKVSVAENKAIYQGLVLDQNRKSCEVDGEEVVLTKLEYDLLYLLVSHIGTVYSRDNILTKVWPDDAIVLDRTVDVNVTRIRKKIGRYGQCIRTRFGFGYSFEDML